MKKKNTKKNTKKEKVKEIFEIEKGKKKKKITKTGESEVEISKKNQSEKQEKILKNILIISGIIILLVLGSYFYVQSLKYSNYKGIDFETVNVGNSDNPLIMYETRTLLPSVDGIPFGFRTRTKPNELKKIPFENLEDFTLMKINGYTYVNGSFDCQGYGQIAMINLQRTFEKMGTQWIYDQNQTCDEEGKYNYFNLKYGEKTEIIEVGNRCYDIIIEGNEEECNIFEGTEKLMVELFVKYKELLE